eukprot:TRINITY_DN8366_c1_g1_i11.p1 TRINITY_DN8366_c1_g1~~TRINITY_DN8366_c1_g1_i11.p1  ORF type:complete len:239 (+),score=-22.82 TRINITY_DN8366_c1_g1_i11:89-805(+)
MLRKIRQYINSVWTFYQCNILINIKWMLCMLLDVASYIQKFCLTQIIIRTELLHQNFVRFLNKSYLTPQKFAQQFRSFFFQNFECGTLYRKIIPHNTLQFNVFEIVFYFVNSLSIQYYRQCIEKVLINCFDFFLSSLNNNNNNNDIDIYIFLDRQIDRYLLWISVNLLGAFHLDQSIRICDCECTCATHFAHVNRFPIWKSYRCWLTLLWKNSSMYFEKLEYMFSNTCYNLILFFQTA